LQLAIGILQMIDMRLEGCGLLQSTLSEVRPPEQNILGRPVFELGSYGVPKIGGGRTPAESPVKGFVEKREDSRSRLGVALLPLTDGFALRVG
jgi:hypothetical protein